MFVREADVAYPLGPGIGASLPRTTTCSRRALLDDQRRRRVGRLGLRRRGSRTSPNCARGSASRSSARAPSAMRKLGDKIGSKLIAEEVGVPVAPWSRGAVDTLDDAVAAATRDRLPADAQGDRRRRRPRHPAWSTTEAELADAYQRTRDEARRAFGNDVGVPRAARHRRPPRRGAGHRRRARHRLGARRARLLGAAPQPEGDRGVGLAAARRPSRSDELKASAERLARGGRLLRRRHRRVPVPPGREVLRVPRGEHPAAGRAPDHRDHHRHRPGPRPAARRGRRPARGRQAGRRPGTPSRRGSTPRTPTATSRRRRDGSSCSNCPRGPGIRVDTGVSEGDTIPADFDSMIAKIIAQRPHPRRGARPAAPRGRRDRRHHRGRRDEQELRARPARPARGHRRHAPTPAGSTGSAPRAGSSSDRHSGVALVAAGIEAYEDDEQVELSRLLETARGGRPQVQHRVGPSDRSQAARARLQGRRVARSARTGSASRSPPTARAHGR